MKKIIGKIKAIWLVLTSSNFILLHSCSEFVKDGKKGFSVAVLRRTDFTDQRDLYIMAGAIKVAFKDLSLNIPDEIDEQFFTEEGGLKRN